MIIEQFHPDTGRAYIIVRDNETCLTAKNRFTKEYHLSELPYRTIFSYINIDSICFYRIGMR